MKGFQYNSKTIKIIEKNVAGAPGMAAKFQSR